MSAAAIDQLLAQRVANALEDYEANRNSKNGNGNRCHDSGSGVKYDTCTFLGGALTWWNSHLRAVGHDVAYVMTWKSLMKIMTEAYYPRSEIKKMVPEESNKVEKYVRGLLDSIQGNVMSARPKMLQEAIELVNSLIDHKVLVYAARQADNKRRMDKTQEKMMLKNHLTRSKMWLGLIWLGLMKGMSMLELYLCATSVGFTTMGCALQSARTVRELVIWHGDRLD
nr:hypothetical protein [Tanacetum cinerariifolium]